MAADDEKFVLLYLRHRLEAARLANACVEVLFELDEQRFETVEVLAFCAIGYFLGGALVGGGTGMPEFVNAVLCSVHAQLGQERIIIKIIGRGSRLGCRGRQELLTVERFEHGAAVRQLSQAIKADCVQPLEYVTICPVLRRFAVLIDKTLDFLETGNNALFALSGPGISGAQRRRCNPWPILDS